MQFPQLHSKAAHNDKIVSIAVTHMERRIGKDVCLTYNAINSPR